MDTIKGLALIATFIGFLTIFAMWVSLWDNVWRVSVEPVRGAIYDARLNRLGLRLPMPQSANAELPPGPPTLAA